MREEIKPTALQKRNWKSVLTVILLIVFWPLGLMLTWLLAPWRRKTKIIITVIFAVLFIISGIVFSLFWERFEGLYFKILDNQIVFNMDQIKSTAEMIYSEEGDYGGINCVHPDISVFCSNIVSATVTTREHPTVHATEEAFCAYIELLSGKYFCIDSQHAAYETAIYPGKEEYCNGQTFVCP